MLGGPARIETHSALALLDFFLAGGLRPSGSSKRYDQTAYGGAPRSTYSAVAAVAARDLSSLKQWVLKRWGSGGGITHLVWDAFTHEGARGVRMIPALDDPVVDIVGHRLMGRFAGCQFLAGLAVVACGRHLRTLRRDSGPEEAPTRTLRQGATRLDFDLRRDGVAARGPFLVMRRSSFGQLSHSSSVSAPLPLCADSPQRGEAC